MSKERERDRSVEGLLRATRRSTQPEAATPACLDAGVIASWAEDALAPEEASRVEAHLTSCARCQAVLAAFARAEPQAPPAVPFWRRWAVLLPVAAATAAASLLWIAWPQRRTPAVPTATMAEAPRVAESQPPPTPVPTPSASAAPEMKEPRTSPKSESKVGARLQPVPGQTTSARAGAVDAVGPTKPDVPPTSTNPVFRSAAPPPGAPVPLAVPQPPARQLPQASGQAAAKPEGITESALAAAAPIAIFQSPEAAGGGAGGASIGAATAGGARPNAVRERANAAGPVTHWRILPSRDLERSTDDGRTWEPVAIDPPPFLTNGAAPSRLVCWLVGRAGVVLVTTDASHFTRLAVPEALDLSTVHATDALNATVMAVDGRSFVTTDGGKTWSEKRVHKTESPGP